LKHYVIKPENFDFSMYCTVISANILITFVHQNVDLLYTDFISFVLNCCYQDMV